MFARVLRRGESLIAGVGVLVVGVYVATLVAGVVVTSRLEAGAARARLVERCTSMAQSLGSAVETSLSRQDPEAARLMVSQASVLHGLSVCRVVLPDGRVVADTDAKKIDTIQLPEVWPGAANGAPVPTEATIEGNRVRTVIGIAIAGRGPALVEVGWKIRPEDGATGSAATALGLCGLVGLVAMWGGYRALRGRLSAIGLIREALLVEDVKGSTAAELAVDASLGGEAAGWNALLADRDRLREASAARQAEAALRAGRAGEGDLTGACDAMWQGMLLIDEGMKVRYANGAAAVMLRTVKETLVGSDLAAHLNESEILDPVRSVVAGGSRQRVSVEIKRAGEDGRPGGGGVLRFGVRPVRREDSAAAMIVIEDVTQQRVADEARNSFVAQATHELRTPLTNIRLYLEQMTDEGESLPVADRAKALNVIAGEVKRLERIVGDMLSVSEIEAGALKLRSGDVRLDVLFKEIEDEYRAQAKEKHIDLVFELPPKLPVMQGDRDKVSLALHNLVGNGLKYTPEGGRVRVKVEAGPRSLVVDVEDNGIGIKPEEHELIFEKFYRARDARVSRITGTGLGLALAREVARLHGGDVLLRSEVDKGSTFTLTLPLAA
jgi:signal transduction histidine kinase